MGPRVTSGIERSSNPGWRWRLAISHARDTMAGGPEHTRAGHGPAADSAGATASADRRVQEMAGDRQRAAATLEIGWRPRTTGG